MEVTRIDRWLWAVRLYKTRSEATAACRGAHVRVNGSPVKPASPVRAGDRVEARVHGRERVFEVVQVLDKRVSATVAGESVVDHSPPPPTPEEETPTFVRDPASGRPTKRDRRRLDQFRSRS